tara:strand:+ start:8 stop:1033 length:1026 start_codon:yes stop_codon:yes gene_type:complete
MISHEKKNNFLFGNWLKINLFLVFLIIIVGGLTRLTDSGLSITEWELFSGILPPLTNDAWNNYFDLYKKIPQFKILNYDMTLSEFKIIFYWEYIHRVLARIIGLFFLIPLVYFYLKRNISKERLNICIVIFLLILIQGIIGWYMVKSGLIEVVTVSHFRLSFHLFFAFLIISTLFWLILNNNKKKLKPFFSLNRKNLPFLFLIFIIFCQIIMGALVSGLDAGKIYQTWPLMGDAFFPNDILIKKINIFFDLNNHSLVQFYHRVLAYLITFYILFLTFYFFKKKNPYLFKPSILILSILFLQISLGILTLISGLNIYLASAHQISSVLLIFGALNLYYSFIK